MKIAVVSTFVPFIDGGGRNIVEWLVVKLAERGHEVEKIYIPQVDSPELIGAQMAAIKEINLDMADLVICIRPQSHLIKHRRKVVWFIHHVRLFYDLWDSEYRFFPSTETNLRIREALFLEDTLALKAAKKVFTNSQVVGNRLLQYNGIESKVLYPPILDATNLEPRGQNKEVIYVSRVEHHKRQHLLVDAMSFVREDVILRICGMSQSESYASEIRKQIQKNGLEDRVIFENKWINDEEKYDRISNSLAVAYLPLDEDSYGYPSIEASHAQKPILTTFDSGGVLELVQHNFNGLIAKPDAKSLAESIDFLAKNRDLASRMGKNSKQRLLELKIDWDFVIEELTN